MNFFFSRHFGGSDVTFGRRNLKPLTNLIPRCVFIIRNRKGLRITALVIFYVALFLPSNPANEKKKLLFRILGRVKAHQSAIIPHSSESCFALRVSIHSLKLSKKIYMGKSSRDVLKPLQYSAKRSEYLLYAMTIIHQPSRQ